MFFRRKAEGEAWPIRPALREESCPIGRAGGLQNADEDLSGRIALSDDTKSGYRPGKTGTFLALREV